MSGPNGTKLRRLLDLGANVLTIVVCLALLGSFVTARFGSKVRPSPRPMVEAGLAKGMNLPRLPGVDYGRKQQTVLLFIKSSCRYCRESLPFFQMIAERAGASGRSQTVAVFPEGDREAAAYLRDGGLRTDQLLYTDLRALKVHATPTIIVVDARSRIQDFWIGEVPDSTQKLILRRL